MKLFYSFLFVFYFIASTSLAQDYITHIREDQLNDPLLAISSNTDIISKEEIQNSGAKNIKELLEKYSSLYFVESGPGGTSSLYMRGSNSNHVLVLYDGIVLNDHTDPSSRFDFSNLELNGIESIELYRGNMSVLYGSGAIGGVLSIKSSESETKKVQLGTGSNSYFHSNLIYSLQEKNHFLKMDLLCSSNFGPSSIGGNSSSLEQDERIQQNIYSLYQYRTVNSKYKIIFKQDNANQEFDQSTASDAVSRAKVQRGLYSFQWDLKSRLHFQINHKDIERDYIYPPSTEYKYQGSDSSYSLRYLSPTESRVFRYALSLEQNFLRSKILEQIDKQEKYTALAIQTSTNLPNSYVFSFGLRGDKRDKESWNDSFRFSLLKEYQNQEYEFSYASAFKFPSSYQLYDPSYGNQDLKNEKARSWDFLWKYKMSNSVFRFAVFRIDTKELIDFQNSNYVNIGSSRSQGIELNYLYNLDPSFRISYNLNLQEAYKQDSKEDLLNRPKQKQSLQLQKITSRNIWSMYFHSVGHREVYGGDVLSPYALVSFHLKTNWEKGIVTNFKIENLMNTHYEEQKGYTTLGRSLYLSVEKSF